MARNFTASTAKEITTQYNSVTVNETALIDMYIVEAVEAGETEVVVGNGSVLNINGTDIVDTLITNNDAVGQSYYNVWKNNTTDRTKQAQMANIINYFEKLGYSITRKSANSTVFYWTISWH